VIAQCKTVDLIPDFFKQKGGRFPSSRSTGNFPPAKKSCQDLWPDDNVLVPDMVFTENSQGSLKVFPASVDYNQIRQFFFRFLMVRCTISFIIA